MCNFFLNVFTFAAVKKYIIRFFTVIVMIALGATVVTGAFSNPRAGIVFVEEEIHGNKTGAKDNGNYNDKSEMPCCLGMPESNKPIHGYLSHNIELSNAFRFLPEMPPDLS
jgi:hypothetical protein